VAYNKPAIFKTSVLNHLTEAQSCVRFAGSEHRAERQAANLREYEDRFRETARLMNKTERHLLEATGKVGARRRGAHTGREPVRASAETLSAAGSEQRSEDHIR
jgi:hypothetical protein